MRLRNIFILLLVVLPLSSVFAQEQIENPYYVHKARGDKYRHLGYLEKALKEYEKATLLRTESPECYYWIASVLKERQLYLQALVELSKAEKYRHYIEDDSRFIDLYYLKSEILIRMGKKRLIKGIKILEDDFVRKYRKSAYQKAQPHIIGQPRDKIEITSNNKRAFAKAHFILGVYYILTNTVKSEKEALSIENLFNTCIDLDFQKAYSNYFLYKYYSKKGKVYQKKAKKYLEEAKELNPNIIIDFKSMNWKDLPEIFSMQ